MPLFIELVALPAADAAKMLAIWLLRRDSILDGDNRP